MNLEDYLMQVLQLDQEASINMVKEEPAFMFTLIEWRDRDE
ncbi:hypothetical protein [uncultured Brevibacillus sp.]|nr:hypothetical protein [uncultured Brevibacillus sp.]